MEDVAREPNGRPSRAKEPADAVALAARAKRWGKPEMGFRYLTKAELRDQRAETFIGYLNIINEHDDDGVGLSDDQYDALQSYLALYGKAKIAMKSKDGTVDQSPKAQSGDAVSDEYIEWCETTIARYEACRRAIQAEQNACRLNLWAALSLCVLRNEPHYHMVGDVRLLANAIDRYFS